MKLLHLDRAEAEGAAPATRAFALSDGWLCQRYSTHPRASPLRGRCKQRSNLLRADLSSLHHTALRPVATGVPACLT